MNVEAFINGVQRANANRKQRQTKQHTKTVSKPASVEPVVVEPSPALGASPMFDLEAFRLDIIRKAISKIMINKQKELNE